MEPGCRSFRSGHISDVRKLSNSTGLNSHCPKYIQGYHCRTVNCRISRRINQLVHWQQLGSTRSMIRCQAESDRESGGVGRGQVLRALSSALVAPFLHLNFLGRADAALPEIPSPSVGQASMRTLSDSELAVSVYPTFAYNALGGGGIATAEQHGNIVRLTFDPAAVNIPDVNYRNTTFMGVPMAPPFSIAVQPKQLEGWIDRSTGKAELTFLADFMFTAGPLYKAPPLKVRTLLTTESVQGEVQGGQGKRLDKDGFAKLVGIARLAPTKDVLLDKFLMLPSDCKALMSAQFVFNPLVI